METLHDDINNNEEELKKEKKELRKKWSTAFLNDLDIIIEKCFLRPKEKKEHFITPDKISIEFLKLLQSQKKFQPSTTTKVKLNLLGIFSIEDNIIGKILSIHLDTQEVIYIDMFLKTHKKKFENLILFDIYSPEMQIYFEMQKKFYDSFSYKDAFGFLTSKIKKEDDKEETMKMRMTTISGTQQIKLDIHIDYDHH